MVPRVPQDDIGVRSARKRRVGSQLDGKPFRGGTTPKHLQLRARVRPIDPHLPKSGRCRPPAPFCVQLPVALASVIGVTDVSELGWYQDSRAERSLRPTGHSKEIRP